MMFSSIKTAGKIFNCWDMFTHDPQTYTSMFCITVGHNQSMPSLERTSGELLYATEALGKQFSEWTTHRPLGAFHLLPIVVTTAQLYVCKYDVGDIDKNTGTLALDQAEFEAVPYIRFEKVITPTPVNWDEIEIFNQVEALQRQTVIVVQASSLHEFLANCTNLKPPFSLTGHLANTSDGAL